MYFSPSQFELATWCETRMSTHTRRLSWDDVAGMHQGTVRSFLIRGYFQEAQDHTHVIWTREGSKALYDFKHSERCWRHVISWKFTAALSGPSKRQQLRHNVVELRKSA